MNPLNRHVIKQGGRLRSLAIIALAMVPTVALVLWYVSPSEPAPAVSPSGVVPGTGIAPGLAPLGLGPVTDARDLAVLPDGHPEVGRRSPSTSNEIAVTVSYAGDLAALPDSALVYVFVREPGSRMPLAVERRNPGELPISVSFSGENLSETELEIVGRLTMDGDVRLKSGDLEVAQPLNADTKQPVRLVIAGSGG